MFTFDEETRTYWFSSASMEAGSEFRLVGQLMGLAIFNSVILDAHFPHCLYLKLVGKKPGFSVSSQTLSALRHSSWPFSIASCWMQTSPTPTLFT